MGIISRQWPADVPAPETDSIRITPGITVVRRRCGKGRVECRRFGDGAPDRVACQLVLEEADEWPAFLAWYTEDLRHGTLWFTADWLSVHGWTDHGARCVGYWQVEGKLAVRTLAIEFLVMPAADVPDILLAPALQPVIELGPAEIPALEVTTEVA